MLCLGIESSCDETALALVKDDTLVEAVVSSQEALHALFGGVVPELASREHYRFIGILYDTLLQRTGIEAHAIDCIAVSRGPGLLGSLLVGVAFAKGLAFALQKKLVGIDHLQAHLLVAGLEKTLTFPALGILVSGGHTHFYRMDDAGENSPPHFQVLGKTLDDAAGEAFDKVGKILGLPYPAGRTFDALATRGRKERPIDPKKVPHFPRPYLDNDTLDFSFSGLKTAASAYVTTHKESLAWHTQCMDTTENRNIDTAPIALCHMCAAFNEAVVDTICTKARRALAQHPDIHTIILAGGVAANSLLRESLQDVISKAQGTFIAPSLHLCTDNAAMVAYAGSLYARAGYSHALSMPTIARGQRIPHDWQSPIASGC